MHCFSSTLIYRAFITQGITNNPNNPHLTTAHCFQLQFICSSCSIPQTLVQTSHQQIHLGSWTFPSCFSKRRNPLSTRSLRSKIWTGPPQLPGSLASLRQFFMRTYSIDLFLNWVSVFLHSMDFSDFLFWLCDVMMPGRPSQVSTSATPWHRSTSSRTQICNFLLPSLKLISQES